MIHGRELIVEIDTKVVAAAKSCRIGLSQNFISVCSPTDGRTVDKVPTTYEWTISVDCLVPNSNLPNDVMDLLIRGKKVMLFFTDEDEQNRAGTAYIKSCQESGSVGSLATFSVEFECFGPLYKSIHAYKPKAFDEGSSAGAMISNGMEVGFEGDRYQVYGVGITLAAGDLLYVKNTEQELVALIQHAFDNQLKTDIYYETSLSTYVEPSSDEQIFWKIGDTAAYTILSNISYQTVFLLRE